jgi:hypothetical protein
VAERFLAGAREDDLAKIFKDGRDRQQVALVVVDEQDPSSLELG